MKKTGLAKSDAKKLMGGLKTENATFGGSAPAPVDRKEQRKRDQALGLVPFAVKLNGDLVAQLHAQARERDTDMNTLVGELLAKALA
jgi:hypothetical protein